MPTLERCCLNNCSPSRTVLSSTTGCVQAGGRRQVGFHCAGPCASWTSSWSSPGWRRIIILAARRARQWSSSTADLPTWPNKRRQRFLISWETGLVQSVWSHTTWLETCCVKLMQSSRRWNHIDFLVKSFGHSPHLRFIEKNWNNKLNIGIFSYVWCWSAICYDRETSVYCIHRQFQSASMFLIHWIDYHHHWKSPLLLYFKKS